MMPGQEIKYRGLSASISTRQDSEAVMEIDFNVPELLPSAYC